VWVCSNWLDAAYPLHMRQYPPPGAYSSPAIESRAAVRVRRRRQEDEQEEVDEAKKPVVTPLRGKRNTGGQQFLE